MHHLWRFFLVATVFDKYFNVKLKMSFGMFFCTFDQKLVGPGEAYYEVEGMINPWEVIVCDSILMFRLNRF